MPRARPPPQTLEQIAKDDECPTCLELLHRPVITTCNHILCHFCMSQWVDAVTANPAEILDVDTRPLTEYDPVTELRASCPCCRTVTQASAAPDREHELREKYPVAYAAREDEARAEEERKEGEGKRKQPLTVYIGNRHTVLGRNRAEVLEDGVVNEHEWNFFVKISRPALVQEVRIQLHETFVPSLLVLRRPPFEVTRTGWGHFTIEVTVVLRNGYEWVSPSSEGAEGAEEGRTGREKEMLWELDFAGFGGKGSMKRCKFEIEGGGLRQSARALDRFA